MQVIFFKHQCGQDVRNVYWFYETSFCPLPGFYGPSTAWGSAGIQISQNRVGKHTSTLWKALQLSCQNHFYEDVCFWVFFCFIESILTFAFICRHGSLSVQQKNNLNNQLDLNKSRSVQKTKAILPDPSHPLWCESVLLLSGCRFKQPLCRTNRYR